jgi:hypothetical protein
VTLKETQHLRYQFGTSKLPDKQRSTPESKKEGANTRWNIGHSNFKRQFQPSAQAGLNDFHKGRPNNYIDTCPPLPFGKKSCYI